MGPTEPTDASVDGYQRRALSEITDQILREMPQPQMRQPMQEVQWGMEQPVLTDWVAVGPNVSGITTRPLCKLRKRKIRALVDVEEEAIRLQREALQASEETGTTVHIPRMEELTARDFDRRLNPILDETDLPF